MPVNVLSSRRRFGSLRRWGLCASGAVIVALAGCATPPPASQPDALADFRETNDPLEPTNRVFYAVNNGIDTVLLRPAAVAYRYVVPETIRSHTHNVLTNLGMPVQLIDDMFAAKPRRAGDTLMRLLINSTIGVAGVFDVATDWGWPDHESDAGMTLALWGISEGPYLFLPILGPSNPRDATGFGVDVAISPSTWVGQGTVVNAINYSRLGLGALDARSQVLDSLDKIKEQALDPYATIRSLYRQHRQSTIDDAQADEQATVPAWFPATPIPPNGAAKP